MKGSIRVGLFSKKEDNSVISVYERKVAALSGEYSKLFVHNGDEDKKLGFLHTSMFMFIRKDVFDFLKALSTREPDLVDQILESTPDEMVNPLNAAAFGFMLGELANKENETLNHEKIEEYIFGSDLEESRKRNFMDITMAVVDFYEKAGLGDCSKKEVDDIMRRTGRDRIMYYSSTPQMANIIYGMLNLPYRRGDAGDSLLMRLTNLLPHIEALAFAINNEAVSEAHIRRLI